MLDLHGTGEVAPAGDLGERTGGDGRRAPSPVWWSVAAVALALVPVVVATARALARGWLPVGDNAYFAIRAQDVLTEHHPLLGTWTSASIAAGTNFNNPGPLLFDVLALPAKLLGDGGVAVGAALLNGLAIVGIAVVAHRRGGPLVAVLAVAATAALTWSMGSELLFDPWQPHSLLLTALLLLLLVWSLACGDVAALPWAVGVASLVVQTHLSYAVLVGALGAWGVVGLAVALRRRRREEPPSWPRHRSAALRAAAAAAVVLLVAWAQPLAEQLREGEDGNLARRATNAGGSPETVGPALGARLVANVVAEPPWWFRPSFERSLQPAASGTERLGGVVRLPELPSTSTAAASLGAVGAVLAGAALLAAHRRDRTSVSAVVTAAVGLGAGLVTAASLPVGAIGIAPHQFRWLWPLAAFATFAVVASLARALVTDRLKTAALAGGVVVVGALAAANLPTYNVGAGPADDEWAIPVVRQLGEQMGALAGEGPLLIDMRRIRFAEPYSGPVMAELQRRGIPFVSDDEGMVRQLGPSRRAEPGAQQLRIREGDATRETPPGERRVALVEGLDQAGQAELAATRDAVLAHLRSLGEVPLNEAGRTALAEGDLPAAAEQPDALTTRPEVLVASRELGAMVDGGLLDLDEAVRPLFDRYAELQEAWDLRTVALFLAPPGAPPA